MHPINSPSPGPPSTHTLVAPPKKKRKRVNREGYGKDHGVKYRLEAEDKYQEAGTGNRREAKKGRPGAPVVNDADARPDDDTWGDLSTIQLQLS